MGESIKEMGQWQTVSVILIRPGVPRADGKVFTKEALIEAAAQGEGFFIDKEGNLCQEVAMGLTLPWEDN
jgi:hypothetical protein